jgi:ribosomal protein L13
MPTNYAITKTTRASKTGFNRPYFLLDASLIPIGRLASEAAKILMGKNRADFSPDVDMGGMVIIINAGQQVLTGKKAERKVYFRYGRRLGSLKARGYEEAKSLDFKFPIYNAIKKMLPKNRHQDLRANNRLIIVENAEHRITAPITEIKLRTDNIYSELANMVVAKKTTPTKVEVKTKAEPVVAKAVAEKPKATVKKESKGDDLKIVEGIGPKIEELLHNAGITTFVQLADASVETLNQILDDAGSRYSTHKSTTPTWAKQAQLAADGKMEELEILQKQLNAGKEEK